MSERDTEDWLVAHPGEFGEGAEIVGRQVSVAHGRIDLLVCTVYACSADIEVVELKDCVAKERDVSQVARYCYDVRNDLEAYILYHYQTCPRAERNTSPYAAALDQIRRTSSGPTPVIIAPDISDNALAALIYCGGRYRRVIRDGKGFYIMDDWYSPKGTYDIYLSATVCNAISNRLALVAMRAVGILGKED